MAFLLGTGIYFTIRLRFIQIREFFHGVLITLGFFEREKHKGEIKHFQALCTALSATVGTGNIAGVATAIALGGPGAVVWMWLTGLFGMALKYASCLLALKYRVIAPDGSVAGGPMYYLERGMRKKWLAVFFAVCTAITATFIGNMIQSNSVADVFYSSLNIPHIVTGCIIAVFVWMVIIGGIKRIAKVTQVIAPFMCIYFNNTRRPHSAQFNAYHSSCIYPHRSHGWICRLGGALYHAYGYCARIIFQ